MGIRNIVNDFLEAEAAKRRALATLHIELGYSSGSELASAIIAATTATPGTSQNHQPRTGDRRKASVKRRGRALAPSHRQAIVSALKSGVSGTQAARDFGVSYPTVHAIKKSLGLVTARPR